MKNSNAKIMLSVVGDIASGLRFKNAEAQSIAIQLISDLNIGSNKIQIFDCNISDTWMFLSFKVTGNYIAKLTFNSNHGNTVALDQNVKTGVNPSSYEITYTTRGGGMYEINSEDQLFELEKAIVNWLLV